MFLVHQTKIIRRDFSLSYSTLLKPPQATTPHYFSSDCKNTPNGLAVQSLAIFSSMAPINNFLNKSDLLYTLLAAVALAVTISSTSAFSLSSSPRQMATRLSATTEPNDSDTAAEEVVRKYFDGVNRKDPEQLRSCFGETATIRDVCGLDATERTVQADVLVERCMEFVTAHPDCLVKFHYGPCEQRERDNMEDGVWVVAHWYENGHWSEDSCGIQAPDPPLPMAVEGQTRFRVSPDPSDNNKPKIQQFVVTRTFTEWENAMVAKRREKSQ